MGEAGAVLLYLAEDQEEVALLGEVLAGVLLLLAGARFRTEDHCMRPVVVED